MKKIAVVCTTIGNGEFIRYYLDKMIDEGIIDGEIIIIADKKTQSLAPYRLWDERIIFIPSLDEQEKFSREVGLENVIGWNTDARRNLGYLYALARGADVVISIDDDNFPREGQYYAKHSVVGELNKVLEFSSDKWFNILQDLTDANIYQRGFPYTKKGIFNIYEHSMVSDRTVAINQGLWVGDPDIDAVTSMSNKGIKLNKTSSLSFVLGKDTWAPINSQNTAVSRAAMAAYFFIPMGNTITGLKIDRWGDIFQGYFAEACVKAMGEYVQIGNPVVDHRRNKHNPVEDLRKELPCIEMMDEFLDWLTEVKFTSTSYSEAYVDLADQMEDAVEKFTGSVWTIDAKAFFHRTAYCMRKWIQAYKRII